MASPLQTSHFTEALAIKELSKLSFSEMRTHLQTTPSLLSDRLRAQLLAIPTSEELAKLSLDDLRAYNPETVYDAEQASCNARLLSDQDKGTIYTEIIHSTITYHFRLKSQNTAFNIRNLAKISGSKEKKVKSEINGGKAKKSRKKKEIQPEEFMEDNGINAETFEKHPWIPLAYMIRIRMMERPG